MKKYFKICTLILAFMMVFAFPISATTKNSTVESVKGLENHKLEDNEDIDEETEDDIKSENDIDDEDVDVDDENDDTNLNKHEWVNEKNSLKKDREIIADKLELLEEEYEEALECNNTELADILKSEITAIKSQISEINEKLHQIRVFYKGEEIKNDVAPVIKEGRVLIPLRALAEIIGAEVAWNQETKSITLTKEDKVIEIVIGDKFFEINGNKVEIDVPAQLINNRTVVPVRFISENLNHQVNWDADNESVDID